MAYNLTGVDLDIFFAANSAANVSLFVFVILPTLILCLLCVMALFLAHSINWPLRVALINIFAGEICYWLGLSVIIMGYPTRAYEPNEIFSCQFSVAAFIAAAMLKFPAIALYAVMVYIFLKYGVKKLKLKVIIPLIAISWVGSLIVSVASYIPSFGHSNSVGFCTSEGRITPIFLLALMVIIVVMLGCLCVIITFSILTYCYFKKNTLEDNVAVKRAVAKNLAYLVMAIILYFIFYLLPASFNSIRHSLSATGVVGIILIEYLLRGVNFSSIATPIVAIVILKPVRLAMKEIFKKMCACCRKIRAPQE